MSIGKGFIEEAHPIQYLILTFLGYNYCQRNQAGEYIIKSKRIILAAMTIVFVAYNVVSDVTIWLENPTYSISIGMTVQHIGKIQMLYVLCEMRYHRKNMATFLNGIGSNFYFERNIFSRLRDFVVGLFQAIFYATMILSLNSFGCYMRRYRCLSFNIGWIIAYYLLPRVMDNQQVILIGPLINSYRFLHKNVKKIQSQAEKSLEMSNTHYDNVPEYIKWKTCMQNYYCNSIQEIRVRLKKLESLTTTFNKVRKEDDCAVVTVVIIFVYCINYSSLSINRI